MNLKQLFADDNAVSPVIGVILMVAITVILAAVIGTFVLGMGEDINQNAQAGVSFSESPNDGDSSLTDVDIQLTSLGNVDSADNIRVEAPSTCTLSGDGGNSRFGAVGDTITASGCDTGKITVIAELDGNENVIANHDI